MYPIMIVIGLRSKSDYQNDLMLQGAVVGMPIIAIASPKGGAGKSTASILLATELAHAGAPVTLVDCDPNHSVSLWAERGTVPAGITVLADISESEIVRTLKRSDTDGHIVIVDLEGVASRLVSRAISQADLVLTPMRATTLDATIGVRALALIQEEEEALGRPIRHAVVFTMTRAIKSKQHTAIEASLRSQGVDVVEPPLMERAAYSALFEFGGNLRTMPVQGNSEAAIANAAGFAEQIYKRLVEKRK